MRFKFLLIGMMAGVNSFAFAAEDFSLMADLMGDSCVVTNDSGEQAEVVQVRFNYSCSDGMVRRTQYKPGDMLRVGEQAIYRFPGTEGGCVNYVVFSCSARGRWINQ